MVYNINEKGKKYSVFQKIKEINKKSTNKKKDFIKNWRIIFSSRLNKALHKEILLGGILNEQS